MNAKKTVTLADHTVLPAIGQGSWYIGDKAENARVEITALRRGIELGMTLIDTAEMYGNGRSESLIGQAIKGLREDVFLVSKVYPHNAGGVALRRSCEASLKRLGVETLDLYLLHWPGQIPYEETVSGMETLIAEGKIRRWGVSNLDITEMKTLSHVPGGAQCAVNQVLYHLGSRGIEYDLLPWQRQHHLPTMAYCPLAQGGRLRQNLFQHPAVLAVAEELAATPAQVLLAWVIRSGDIIAIPKAGSIAHVEENARAMTLHLSTEHLQQLDRAFPEPRYPEPLDIM